MIFPNEKYEVIYCDPPWSYSQQGKTARGVAANHYSTMSIDDICKLPVMDITTENAICFMWATFPNIGGALDVMQKWGFIYKTAAFIWVKKNKKSNSNFWGMGSYTRANAEICLLGVSKKTKATEMVINRGIHQIIEAPIEQHSKKPDIVRDKIVELVGDRPRIELFARTTAPGWAAWGNEVGKLDIL
jgi:N6-adenosine-specific RNA methylase IME4